MILIDKIKNIALSYNSNIQISNIFIQYEYHYNFKYLNILLRIKVMLESHDHISWEILSRINEINTNNEYKKLSSPSHNIKVVHAVRWKSNWFDLNDMVIYKSCYFIRCY